MGWSNIIINNNSSKIRPWQPSFCWIKFWPVRNPLPQSIRLRLSVLVRYSAIQRDVYPQTKRPQMEGKTNTPITICLNFLVCYVATQIANPLHQTRVQVVRLVFGFWFVTPPHS